MDDPLSFGRWLRRRRRALDLTQAQLAQQVGYAEVTLRKIEADELRPSKQMAATLATHLEIAPADRAAFARFARDERRAVAAASSSLGDRWQPFGVAELGPVLGGTARSLIRPPVGAPVRHNLPVPLTTFIGREREISRVRDLLRRTHLLTLTGAGGCGKTRLAREAAAGLMDIFPEGVWQVELR
jgi:transcriptional regulator with XRE-family HTH domain